MKVFKLMGSGSLLQAHLTGAAIGFKLEAALELLSGVEVIVMPPTEIKAALKDNGMFVDFAETGLKSFQKPAFETALAYVSKDL